MIAFKSVLLAIGVSAAIVSASPFGALASDDEDNLSSKGSFATKGEMREKVSLDTRKAQMLLYMFWDVAGTRMTSGDLEGLRILLDYFGKRQFLTATEMKALNGLIEAAAKGDKIAYKLGVEQLRKGWEAAKEE